MAVSRWFKHLAHTPAATRRAFPAAVLDQVEHTVKAFESRHEGEIRFVVEGALDLPELWAGLDARGRAIQLFSELRVWDTALNSGVLIYVLLADHQVEILADRGVHAQCGPETWARICKAMTQAFAQGDFEAGSVAGVKAVGEVLAQHFPPGAGPAGNELPDRPLVL